MKQLEMLEVSWMFNAIVGVDNILGASKLLTALKWFSQQDYDPQYGCLIGDTTHDYDVAHALGLDCILLTHGHNDFYRLSQTPATVITDWAKLKDIL
jgi:phosphoglycolate phosphatase